MQTRARTAFVTALVGLVGVVVVAPTGGVVVAQESCSERVPWVAWTDAEMSSTAGDGTLQPVASLVAPLGVAAGAGTTVASGGYAAAAASGTATGLAAVSAFFAASMLTCGVLDVSVNGRPIGGYLDAVVGHVLDLPGVDTTPPVGSELITNTPYNCAANLSTGFPNGTGSLWNTYTAEGCRLVTMPGFASGRAVSTGRYVVANDVERTIGGNVLPANGIDSGSYPLSVENSMVALCWRGGAFCVGPSQGSASPWNPRTLLGPSDNGYTGRNWSQEMTTSERLMVRCSGANVGGVCGTTPRRLFAVVDPAALGGASIEAVFQPFPRADTHGWSRRWVVDTRCSTVATTPAHTWYRVESESWWDATVHVRVPVGGCDSPRVPTGYRIAAVPTGIACTLTTTAAATACDGDRWVKETVLLPSTLTATATAPDWIVCLQAYNSCPGPQMVEDVCTWNGHELEGGCDPEAQLDAGTIPQTATIPVPNATTESPVSTLDPVTTPGEEPGGGSGIVVPIDPGSDEKCSDPSETACFGPVIDLSSSGECFPNGWGWFNPVQWVLRPIKCAFVWAFVPADEDLDAFVSSVKSSVEGTFPLSLFPVLHGTVTDFAAAASASDAECLAVGEFGGEVHCLELPTDFLTTGQRSTVTAVMVSLVILGVAFHAVRLVTDR